MITGQHIKNAIVPHLKQGVLSTFKNVTAFWELEKANGFSSSAKMRSEWISYNFGQKLKEYLESLPELNNIQVIAGKSDNDVDMVFKDKTTLEDYLMEIKVSCSTQWRGGEFSIRESDHLMIYWNQRDGIFDIYSSLLYLAKTDWISQMAQGKNYYAPSVSRALLAAKERLDINGKIIDWQVKNNKNFIKMDYEHI